MIKLKRTYDPPSKKDGFRLLVDRIWPRGLSKEEAKVDLWLREIAPSDELRRWFSHDSEKWKEFQKRYQVELRGKEDLLNQIKQIEKERGIVTFLYSTREEAQNNAVALKNILQKSAAR